ncbi:hypothetical protein LguiA_011431 [Lonicera macranthoides]
MEDEGIHIFASFFSSRPAFAVIYSLNISKKDSVAKDTMDSFIDTEIQTFNSPFLSPSSSSPGNNIKVGIEDEYQDTVPFDDTAVLESPTGEPQLVNLDAETEVLDDSERVDDSEKEVVLDSDDEEIDRTQVASVMKGISSAETQRSDGGDMLDLEKSQLAPATKRCYLEPLSCLSGYLQKRSSTVGAQSLGAYCSATSSLSDKGSDCEPKSVHMGTHNRKQHAVNEDGVEDQMKERIVKKVYQDHDSWECIAKGSDFEDENKSSDRTRKVSTGDVFVMEKLCSSDSETMGRGKYASLVTCDPKVTTLSYIESQEPGDPSQANALDFVDHYLSVIDVNLPQDFENRKATRMKSPPALSAKGPQSLARKTNLMTKFGESRSFDWDENQTDDAGVSIFRKINELILDCKSHVPSLVSMPQATNNPSFQKEKNLGEECKEKLHNSNEIDEMVQTAKMKSDTNFVAELDKQFDLESSAHLLENDGIRMEAPEIFDVGFDTQMAAEAMEALLYAPPPNTNASALQGLETTLEDSPKGARKDFSSLDEMPESGFVGRQSNGTTRRSNKLNSSVQTLAKNKNKLNLDLPITKKVARRKPETGNYLNYRNRTDSKSSSHERSSEVIAQREEQGTPKRKNITEVDEIISSSKSVKHNSLSKEPIRGHFSPIACRTRRHASAHSPKRAEYSECGAGERMNLDVMKVGVIKRKGNISSTDEFHMLDVRKKCPRLGSKTSRQATNSEVNKHERTDPLAASIHSKLDIWTFPKRKRTRPSLPHHLKVLSNLGGVNKCDLAVRSEEKACITSEKDKASSQSGKVDDVNSILSSDAVENIKLDVLSDMNAKSSPVHKDGEKCKQPFKKKHSKLPLTKELTRLGFADSLPDFTSKDQRRRRKMANVRVLFSQSLDADIMKQQRKISARLGISVALRCSDATHFITDRFVRTSNMLEAIAAGKPVVTHLWLETCAQASFFVDEKRYILRDAKKEKEIGFSMPVSLARARQIPLLKGRRVFITTNVKPGKEIVETLVKAVCGQVCSSALILD